MNIPGRKSSNGQHAELLPPPVQRPRDLVVDGAWVEPVAWAQPAEPVEPATYDSAAQSWPAPASDAAAWPPVQPVEWTPGDGEPITYTEPDPEAWSDGSDAQTAYAPESASAPESTDVPLDTWSASEDPATFDGRVAEAFGTEEGREPTADEWRVDAANGSLVPLSAVAVLNSLGDKVNTGHVEQYQPVPLGFTPLDRTIGGGLRVGELMLIGGAQGTGKTTMALQMARNIVLGGQASVLYVCFEHDEEYMLNRLISMESALAATNNKAGAVKLQDVRKEILGTWLAQGSGTADLSMNPRLRPALDRISRYGQNLFLLRGSQTTTTIENLRDLISKYRKLAGDRNLVVFIDYLQKVPMIPEPDTETEKVTFIVNGLKDIALSLEVPLISIVAADKEGLKAKRLRNYHLRGSSAINYEADIIMILNEKYNIVAKVNIEFNPYMAQRFRDWVVLSVEKNRGGQHSVDIEFEKHFEFSCFDANGRTVQEKLVEERLFND